MQIQFIFPSDISSRQTPRLSHPRVKPERVHPSTSCGRFIARRAPGVWVVTLFCLCARFLVLTRRLLQDPVPSRRSSHAVGTSDLFSLAFIVIDRSSSLLHCAPVPLIAAAVVVFLAFIDNYTNHVNRMLCK